MLPGQAAGVKRRQPAYRKFVREVSKGGLTPPNLTEYFGYELFVGVK